VKTEYGYHVILTEDKKGGNNISYEDAKARIENGLRMEKFQETVSKKAQELRKKANIVLK
jgi:parvulin-like peptidyl-prolyl isomerase